MKRTLAIFTAAALALTLAACGADMTDVNDYAARPSETVASTGAVAGAMNRAADDYRYAYTPRNNGGYTWDNRTGSVSNADGAANADSGRYQLMLENGRVHDSDGYLLDGENARYHTW